MQTLNKENLFSQITSKIVHSLGFKKALILDLDDMNTKVNVGFNNEQADIIRNIFKYRKETLKEDQLSNPGSEISKQLADELQSKRILVAPIEERERVSAIFVVSELLLHAEISESEKEAFQIIGMYLSRCLDNIRLFEDIYNSKDELEKKIKERTNELIKSLRKIEVVSKMKSDFISSVSHELRTPLTSVKGFSSLLVMEKFGKLSPEVKERLIKIDTNVNKLVDMINVLLDISRIESGKSEVKMVSGDIVRVIKDVGDLLTPQMHNNKIEFKTALPEVMTVIMDKKLIERVLINLINNSIKFTPAGGQIVVKCNKEKDLAIIAISDNGVGIAKEDLEKVFQEFYRTSVTATMPGTGLGLSLVKRIIDTHKEKIWVDSEPGKGTTFYFTLKLEEDV